MPTETFSKEEFESSLPPLWYGLGLVEGEYCYTVPVTKKDVKTAEVEIYIRSSVNSSGFCAPTGKDSIRLTLVDAVTRRPLAAKNTKSQRWVARTRNWKENMLGVMRDLYKVGLMLGTCPKCGKGQLVLRKSNSVHNPGRLFVTCSYGHKQTGCGRFVWVDGVIK